MSALNYQDILDDVVAAVSYLPDPSTLVACALVSSKWRASAHRFVLQRIKLSSLARFDELTELLQRDPSAGALVHVLIIEETPLTSSPWIAEFPHILAPKLPCLRAIHLVNLCDIDKAFGRQFVEGLSMFTTVEKLSVIRNIVDAVRIEAMAAALPNIRHLHLDLLMPLDFNYPEPPKIHNPQLLSLEIEARQVQACTATRFLEWVASTPSSQSLRSLRLGINFGDVVQAGLFLTNVGSRLKELELTLEMVAPLCFESEIIRDDISLAQCTSVQALTLCHPRGPVCPVVLELLAEVPSQDIRELTLGVVSIDNLELDNGIDPPGQLPNFSPLLRHVPHSVQELTVLYSGTLVEQAIVTRLRYDLHPIAARCKVSVRRV